MVLFNFLSQFKVAIVFYLKGGFCGGMLRAKGGEVGPAVQVQRLACLASGQVLREGVALGDSFKGGGKKLSEGRSIHLSLSGLQGGGLASLGVPYLSGYLLQVNTSVDTMQGKARATIARIYAGLRRSAQEGPKIVCRKIGAVRSSDPLDGLGVQR